MSRDYRKNAPKRRGGGVGGGFTGWAGLGIGLAIGLTVAAGVWIAKDPPAPEPVAAEQPEKPAPMSAQEEAAPEQDANGSATDFTFYDKLKNFEVVIPEKDEQAARDLRPAPETRPGTYVLQAGSYRKYEDADRVRAQLALQGVESKVQKVTVDADTWHRVRIGPITNLNELNRVRTRLRQAEVDALVIRVGD